MDIAMAVILTLLILGALLAIIWSVAWVMLRGEDKIGPLAKAEQDHRIETHRIQSVLKAKQAEAQIALADAEIIKAKATVVEAQARATELDMERLDRQLTRGNNHRVAE